MTPSLLLFTDCPHNIIVAINIHPLSLVIDPSANHHSDAVFILRVTRGPDLILREGCGHVRVEPEILARVGEVCPQTDGEPLVGRFVGILHPVLDTGPLLLGLMHCQPTTKQSRINKLIIINIEISDLTGTPRRGRSSLCSQAPRGTCGPPSLGRNTWLRRGLSSRRHRPS